MKLYKRNAKGDPICWEITESGSNFITVTHGLVEGKQHTEIIPITKKTVSEIKSRITAKRKEGYKELSELYDNAPTELSDIKDLKQYLKTYLPKYNTTTLGFTLPMLAKTLEDNKPFEKNGTMLGQWKINGLRCIIGVERVFGDMFNPYRCTYTSREGTKWNLSWMDKIILSKLKGSLLDMMVEEGVCLDGELYLPGYSVNDINSFVKNRTLKEHYKLQYWCYDLCAESIVANARYNILNRFFNKNVANIYTKEDHLNNKEQFVLLPSVSVKDITKAHILRDEYIELGFEGIILRNSFVDYAFGKRNSSMYKYKKKLDGLFTIIDIQEDKRGLPVYTLKNDINEETFECTLNAPHDAQRTQLKMSKLLINKKGLVEYRERSGVKQVPFHAKLIKVFI